MGYDWKKLEREENERSDRCSRQAAVGWIGIGVLGPLAGFLLTGSYGWESGVVWVLMGLVVLVPLLIADRRRRNG